MELVKIAVAGDFNPEYEAHHATNSALKHAAEALGVRVHSPWIATARIDHDPELLQEFDGIFASPGSPYVSFDGMLQAIKFARTRKWPFVGT